MSHCVAGHTFNSLTPGEFCRSENCEGVSSLVELCAQAAYISVDDLGFAHRGRATQYEINQALEAKKALEACIEKMFK